MPANGYSLGKDVTLDIVTRSQGVVRPAIRTGFQSKQETIDIKVKRADGITDNMWLPDGWTGSFDFERQDDSLDAYFARREDAFYQGGDIDQVSITETISNPDGSISQYRYTNVCMKYDDAGSKTGDATIKQKVMWCASRRLKVA